MVPRLLLILTLATLLLSTGALALAAEPPTTISGGDLPHPVRVAPVDEEALFERINLPPVLDEAPKTAGASYTIVSSYWDLVVRNKQDGSPVVDTTATYYPEGGFVKARQAGADAWIVLDLRQRAILDRYIRLDARLTATPGILQVLTAAASAGEVLGVQVGSQVLSTAQTATFWQSFGGLAPVAGAVEPTPAEAAAGTWVVVTLPEGRTIELLYTKVIFEPVGKEVYSVPGGIIGEGPGGTLPAPASVKQERGAGSPLWWPLMLGGGLIAIGIAVWFNRRFGAPPPPAP